MKWRSNNPRRKRNQERTQRLQREAREKRGNAAKARFSSAFAAPAKSMLWRP